MRRPLLSVALTAVLAVPSFLSAQRPLLLVPQPREARSEREITLARGIEVVIPSDADDAFAARDLRDALREFGVALATGAGSARVVFVRSSSPAGKEIIAKHRLTF